MGGPPVKLGAIVMSENRFVQVSQSAGIARVLINRPDALNALNAAVLQQLAEVFDQLGRMKFSDLRVVVLEGAGEKAFVAGADIKLMQVATRLELREFIALGQSVMRQIERLPVPVIAAVDGFAIGGGLELALACDLTIATARSKMGQAEVNLGLIPGFGGTQRLLSRVGVGTAKRLIFTGENISAEEAVRLGVVDYCVSVEEFEVKVNQLAETMASKSSFALAAAKRAIDNATVEARLAGLTREVEEFIGLFEFDDTKEGLAAFIEKRKPQFKGER